MKFLRKLLKKTCWRIKATQRRIEIKRLQKRIKELEISRNTWKVKATVRQAKIEEVEKQKSEIEQELKKN
jgi:hypothetical protein